MPVKNGQHDLRWKTPSTRPNSRFAEFFAGIGLVRMGLEKAGWSIGYANDIDADKREMYNDHFGDADLHFDLEDVHKVRGTDIPTVDLATASFPCTDLSLAGSRLGFDGEQSSSFWGFINVLREQGVNKPRLILLENVLGFATSHGGNDFRDALLGLNSLGYTVDPFVLDAKWFVPQSRQRLFVVAQLDGPADDHAIGPTRTRPEFLTKFVNEHPEIAWSIRHLPEPPASSDLRLDDILENLPPNSPEWWNDDRKHYLYNQFSERHLAVANKMIGGVRTSYGTVFRRVRRQADGSKRSMGELRTDGIAGCLRTPKGGSGRQILFTAGNGDFGVRLLTPRECARLMGADTFTINVRNNQAFFGFGDAVCVPAITWIAENYLNPIVQGRESTPNLSSVST